MTGSVSAFGYSVPITVVLVFLALVIGLALAVMFWLTVAWSVYRSVQRTRRQRVRSDLEDELLDRLFDPEADWETWVDSLASVERSVAESLLDEYVRELDGSEAEGLEHLGAALGIPERSRRQLDSRREYVRLSALTWLTLLSRPDVLRSTDFAPTTPRERAAVARLRYECDDLDTPREGIDVLLEGARTQFTVFGQDTLYRIARDDPAALFDRAAADYRRWSRPLLVQVLTVCRHLGTSVGRTDLTWLIASLEHDDEAVRAATARALTDLGWRADLRDQPFLNRLGEDPSPRVRGAVYEMLASWGDARAISTLTDALEREPDQRARLTGTDALVAHRDTRPADSSPALSAAWDWSDEHATLDTIARRREVSD